MYINTRNKILFNNIKHFKMFSNFFIFISIVFYIGFADVTLAKTKKCCSNQYMVNNNFKQSQCSKLNKTLKNSTLESKFFFFNIDYKKTFSAVCASSQECDESKGLICNGKCRYNF